MTIIAGDEHPERLLYDVDNQIWYDDLGDGTVRAGFVPGAMRLAGDVLVFTPKRLGHSFEASRWFAMIECGKWVGAARAAFDGIVIAHNETLVSRPGLLNTDAFGEGWMLIVRPDREDWRQGLVTGPEVGPAFQAWIDAEAYLARKDG